jgi:hypothetical protein
LGWDFAKPPFGCYKVVDGTHCGPLSARHGAKQIASRGQGRASARASGCSITQIERLTFRVPEYSADGIASLLANLRRSLPPHWAVFRARAGFLGPASPCPCHPTIPSSPVELSNRGSPFTTRPPDPRPCWPAPWSPRLTLAAHERRASPLDASGPPTIMPCRSCVDELPWMLQFISKLSPLIFALVMPLPPSHRPGLHVLV